MADSSGNRIVLTFEVDDKGVVTGLGKVKGEVGDFANDSKSWGKDLKDGLADGLDKVGLGLGELSVAGGVAIFAEAIKSSYEFSGVLSDLHDKTGLSIGFLQDLKFAGDQVGVPLEASAKGVQQLQKRIVEGGPDITKALKSVGLTVSELRSQSPDQMFESIAKAVAGVEDPAQRTALATQVMGKAGADLIPLLANFEETRQGAVHLSDDAVAGFDALGDAISRWKSNAEADIGNFVGHLTSLKGGLKDFMEVVSGTTAWTPIIDAASNSIGGLAGLDDKTNEALASVGKNLDHVGAFATSAAPPLKSAAEAMAEFEKANGTPEQQKARVAAAEAEDKHAEAIQKLADTLTGKDVAQKLKDMAAAEQLAEKQGGLTAYQQEQLGDELLKLSQQGAKIPPVLQPILERAQMLSLNSKLATDGVAGLNKELKDFPSYGLQALPTFDNLINRSGDLNKFLKDELGPAIHQLPAPPPDPWQAWHDGVKDMLDGPNGLVANMETTIGSLTHGWDDFWGNLKQTASNVFDELVDMLVKQFLDPALQAILGRQSAFGQAMSNLFHIPAAGSVAGAASGAGGAASGVGGGAAGGGSAAGSVIGTIGAYAAPALAVLEFGNLLNDTGLLGQNSFDSRDRDAMIAQLGLGQYGYQYSTDQLQAMIDSGQVPQMADGGIVHAQPGGGLFRLGEGRFDEMVTPLDPRDMTTDEDRPIRVYLDGREVGRNQVRHIPNLLFGAGY